jgi:hypothetical protein
MKVVGISMPDWGTDQARIAIRTSDAQALHFSSMLGSDEHPDTRTAMANLAFTLKSQTQNQEALSLNLFSVGEVVLSYSKTPPFVISHEL